MTTILLTQRSEALADSLRAHYPDVTFAVANDVDAQKQALPDADAMIGWPIAEALPAARRLRWVHIMSAGIEGLRNVPTLIDMDDVVLTNSRGAHAPTMADHFFAFLLSLTRDIPGLLRDKEAHRWQPTNYRGRLRGLEGSVLGILGLGNIGSEIARRAVAFGMQIRGIDVNPSVHCPGLADVWGLDRLDDLLRSADYVVVALPITAQTEGMIGARQLTVMQPDAMLFVMSRGGIVDQDALANAIAAGKLAGAALDATRPEPLPAEHPLWTLPNVLISPHISPVSEQTGERLQQILRENLRRFLAGEPLVNLCDKRAGY